ncbi:MULTISPECIES: MFS transporter [Clostridium]|uniref:MFS transporter n=1 Tax=Clostridium cibarium TaxID=2762247 RepID=A0ABR8PPT9_9CLOT|nr:MFS transporter [Clostridium sp. HBUAS56017]MBD7910185.1 MFS transporter [Clostridium cibarium]
MKKSKNIWMYFGGRFVSLIGSGIQSIALPLFILDLTGSGTLMGMFSILTLVPALITSPFSGILGDRKNRKNIMVTMDLCRGVLICLFGIFAMMGTLNIFILFSLQVFISIMDSLFDASSAALMPDLISREELIEANSAKGGFDAAANILGPALGGVIYGIWGIKMVFLINGLSFLSSAMFSLLITYRRKVVEKEKINTKLFLSENLEVLKFIVRKKGLLQLFSFAMTSNFLLVPLFDILMPYTLKKEIGFASEQYGYIICFFTTGILFGNIAISAYFKRLGLKRLMKLGLMIETAITLIVCALIFPKSVEIYGGATFALFLSISICCIGMGFFNAFVNTPISTNLQNLVPPGMRSRFFSILGMFSRGAIPIGSFIFGVLLDAMKYYNIFTIVNLLSILVTGIFLIKACDEAYEAKE